MAAAGSRSFLRLFSAGFRDYIRNLLVGAVARMGHPLPGLRRSGFDVAGACPEGRSCPPGITPAGGQECPHDRRVAKHDHLNNRQLAIVIGSVDRLPFGHRAMEAGDIGRLDGPAPADP